MSWLSPLQAPMKKPRLRKDGTPMPNTSKPVTINGYRYKSMTEACKALHCSHSKIYRLIGEGWRVR